MTFSAGDRAFMRRALFAAERGRGRTSPNPIVGAVIVDDGVVVGQGAHLAAGTPHAEVHALEQAGERARGATLYCTLEPCSHHGRTAPCAPRVAEAGIARVVIAMQDPNPLVAGRGIALLRERGIQVDVGVFEEDARRANAAFVTWITRRRPHVTIKFARSIDGYVGRAPSPGASEHVAPPSPKASEGRGVKITGAAMDRLMHRQRAEIDAIAVGSGTLLADDPQLTARGAHRARPLVRVVFDWRLRCAGDRALYRTLDQGPVVIVTTTAAREAQAREAENLARRGVDIVALAERDLPAALAELGRRAITSLLVEGGPALQDAFAAAGLVDRVQEIVAPSPLEYGVRAPSLLALEGQLSSASVTVAGRDTLLESDVHRVD